MRDINCKLRKLIAVAGAVFLILAAIARIDTEKEDDDGFQTREFDDIW